MLGPLQGVRVLDVGTAGVGPWAATLLGLLGADVLKIEAPSGDRHLYQPPLQNGISTTYTSLNLNKRAAVLDLKDPALRPAIDRLVRQADVVTDNLRPGAVDRMGVGYEQLRPLNPRIISASSPAWGERGPLRGVPAFDPQVQVFSGFASLNGAPGGRPEMLRYPHLDFNGSCFFASAVVLGLLARERTGRGMRITASHLGGALAVQATRIAGFLTTGELPRPLGSADAAAAPHQYFRCQDGVYLAVGAETELQWRGLCHALRRDDLLADQRFTTNLDRVAHRTALVSELERTFAGRPARWWTIQLEAARVPHAFLLDFDRLCRDEHILANGFLTKISPRHQGTMVVGQVPWNFSATPAAITIDGAAQGEHTEEILAHGFGPAAPEIQADASGVDGLSGDGVPLPLTGLRVLDATQGYAGPFAGLLLAEAGAEVVKVEPPGGDYARGFAPASAAGDSAVFLALNHNKRSIVLDLEDGRDRQTYRALAASMDVVLEDWGPGVASARGLGYEDLRALRHDVVYCTISAFGERGPLRDRPGCELAIQALTEYWKNLGPVGGEPERVGADLAGLNTGTVAFLGILAALYHRRRTGEGQRVALSMLGVMMFLRTAQWAAVTNPDSWDGDTYCNNHVSGPRYGYQAKDRPIYFTFNNASEAQYVTVLQEFGMLEEVMNDPRFGNAGRDAVGHGAYTYEVWDIWEKYFKQRSHREVTEILQRNGAAAIEWQTLDEVLDHPQVRSLELVERDPSGRQHLRMPWEGPWPRVALWPAPALDQHRDAILAGVHVAT